MREEYPHARWVWKYPDSKARFRHGEELSILLNRAAIHLQGKRLFEIRYLSPPAGKPQLEQPEDPVPHQEEQAPVEEAAPKHEASQPEDFSLTAFEWVESHLTELNDLYNECVAQKQDFLLLTGRDLPEPADRPALCQELARNGLTSSMTEDGVRIQIKRGTAERNDGYAHIADKPV